MFDIQRFAEGGKGGEVQQELQVAPVVEKSGADIKKVSIDSTPRVDDGFMKIISENQVKRG